MHGVMEPRRRKKLEEEAERKQAMRKGWNLVQSYAAEEPGNLSTEDHPVISEDAIAEARARRNRSFRIQGEIPALQEEVVGWIETAMVGWFNFYFAIGEGRASNRLDDASEALGKASDRLETLGEQIRGLPGRDYLWDDPIVIYADAVDTWSSAFDLISRGARLDRGSLAKEGLAQISNASEKAERVVLPVSGPKMRPSLASALSTLGRLTPPARTSKKAIDSAKAPWSRALLAAGSPFDWTAWPS